MKKERLVCSCSNVSEYEVQAVFSTYPDIPLDALRRSLNIGVRCGCCRSINCDLVDIKFEDLIKELKEK
jgi:bacterioferritin-associated ferredoxin